MMGPLDLPGVRMCEFCACAGEIVMLGYMQHGNPHHKKRPNVLIS